ncbi:phosphotransferase, partial [Rickettsiales bacterium]|nr:phosphotransferase [Rickettsiales bacterium]
KNDYDLHGCKKLFQELVTRRAIDQEQYHFLEEILNTDLHPIAGLSDELDKGIVHGDMFPDNVFFKEDKVSGLIDFYFASYDFLIYDLAIAINAWGFDQEIRFNKERSLTIINSYNSIRPLKNNDREYFKHFCLLAATRFYLTRLHDAFLGKNDNSHIDLKNPDEFLARVRFFKQWRGIKT